MDETDADGARARPRGKSRASSVFERAALARRSLGRRSTGGGGGEDPGLAPQLSATSAAAPDVKEYNVQLGPAGEDLDEWADPAETSQDTRSTTRSSKNPDEDPGVVAQVGRAVSLGFLLRFAAYVKQHEPDNFRRMKTKDLVHGFGREPHVHEGKCTYEEDPAAYSIRGLTREATSNMADFLNGVDDSGNPNSLHHQLSAIIPPEIQELHKAAANNMRAQARNEAFGETTRGSKASKASRGSVTSKSSQMGRKAAQRQRELQRARKDDSDDLALDAKDRDDDDVPEGPSVTSGEDLTGAIGSFTEVPWFGHADFFVSHAWEIRFEILIEALKNPRTSGSDSFEEHCKKYFWIDIFAVNQHYLGDHKDSARVEREREEDLDNFEKVIESARSGMVLVMTPWHKPVILERSWCWYEIALALEHGKGLNLALTPRQAVELRDVANAFTKKEDEQSTPEKRNVKLVGRMLKEIDVEKSSCLLEADREMIMGKIEGKLGSKIVTQRVKLAVAGLLMTTADSLLHRLHATGTNALYDAMLKHFDHAPRERALALNKLVRVYLIMGRKDRAVSVCEGAIKIQRDLLSRVDESERRELELELAVNLNSLGRVYGDINGDPNALTTALPYLEEAREYCEAHEDDNALQEVLYNTGRAYVLHHENFRPAGYIDLNVLADPLLAAPHQGVSTRPRREDLKAAKKALKKTKHIQEDMEKDMGKVLPSLGACYVFLAKVIDLMQDDEEIARLKSRWPRLPGGRRSAQDAAASYLGGYDSEDEESNPEESDKAYRLLRKGAQKQSEGFGPQDPRVFMTQLDTGRHLVRHQTYDPYSAWTCFASAHNGLMNLVKVLGLDPTKLLECQLEMFRLLRGVSESLNREPSEDIFPGCTKLENNALDLIDWIEVYRAHQADNDEIKRLFAQVRGLVVSRRGSKLRLVLERIAEKRDGYDDDDDVEKFPLEDPVAAYEAFQSEVAADEDVHPARPPIRLPAALRMKMEPMLASMPAGMADVILSDAPYNRAIDRAWDEMGHHEFIKKIQRWSRLMVRALAPDGIGFAFTDAAYASYWMHELRTARGAAPLHETSPDPAPAVIVESVVWFKEDADWRKAFIDANPQMNSAPSFNCPQLVRDCIEIVIIFRRSEAAATSFKDIVTDALRDDAANVWQIKKCKEPERIMGEHWHPAQKPLSLMKMLVQIGLTQAKDRQIQREKAQGKRVSVDDVLGEELLVVEPFLGTGSGVMAAMQLGIPSLGCDLDQKWIDVVEKRASKEAKSVPPSVSKSLTSRLGSMGRRTFSSWFGEGTAL